MDFVTTGADTGYHVVGPSDGCLIPAFGSHPLFLAPGQAIRGGLEEGRMPKRWRKFCVYYTQQGGEVCHAPAFATRREAERHADDMRIRAGITNVYVKFGDKAV